MSIQQVKGKICINRDHSNKIRGSHPVADSGGSRFPWKTPFKIHILSNRTVRSRLSNRAVGLRCSNYSSFIRNYAVIMQERLVIGKEYKG